MFREQPDSWACASRQTWHITHASYAASLKTIMTKVNYSLPLSPKSSIAVAVVTEFCATLFVCLHISVPEHWTPMEETIAFPVSPLINLPDVEGWCKSIRRLKNSWKKICKENFFFYSCCSEHSHLTSSSSLHFERVGFSSVPVIAPRAANLKLAKKFAKSCLSLDGEGRNWGPQTAWQFFPITNPLNTVRAWAFATYIRTDTPARSAWRRRGGSCHSQNCGGEGKQ